MILRSIVTIVGLSFASTVGFAAAKSEQKAAAPAAQLEEYVVDTVHSEVGFSVKHMGISNVKGRFSKFSGEFSFNPSDFSKTVLKAEADVESVDTGMPKRDDHLKQEDFFDAKKFPKLTFVSKSAKKTGKNTFDLTGDLTMHGVTKPTTFKVTYNGMQTANGQQRTGFEGVTTVSRKDFGMSFNKLAEGVQMVGDAVQIHVNVEAIRKADVK